MTLEKAGVPTCSVMTEVFAFKTRKEAEVLEMGALPLVIIPHPVGQLPDKDMRRITDENFAEFEFALTGDVDQIASRYRDRTKREPFSG